MDNQINSHHNLMALNNNQHKYLNQKVQQILANQTQVTIFQIDNIRSKMNRPSLNRKEKSLQELTGRFMKMMVCKQQQFQNLNQISDILGILCSDCSVDNKDLISKTVHQYIQLHSIIDKQFIYICELLFWLGVDKRKIYDILNIMESIRLIKRVDKKTICYEGVQYLDSFLQQIQSKYSRTDAGKKQKQLEYLSAGLIRVFKFKKSVITLEQAALYLSLENQKEKVEKRLKTKIRRLYDIVNIFKSIGLIQKVRVENNKPGYKWLGIEGIIEYIDKEISTKVDTTYKQEEKYCHPIIIQTSRQQQQNVNILTN